MRFVALGVVAVLQDDASRTPKGAKERAVLARLLAGRGQPVSADTLIDAIWPGADPEVAARSLHVRVANLRRFLEPDREAGAPPAVLVRDGASYRLAVDPSAIDLVRFERLVGDAVAATDPATALTTADAALALWGGRPFADVADTGFLTEEIERLDEVRARAVGCRAQALVDLGRHDEALPELRGLVAEDPLRAEPAHALAVALYRAGRQADALDAVRGHAAALREIGLDPSQATEDLERRLLAHDMPDSRVAVAVVPSRPVVPRPASLLFGRERQLEDAATLIADRPLVTITGPGGAGKTRLALELAARSNGGMAGPWYCELAPVADEDEIPGAIAAALRLTAGAGLDDAAALLAQRPGLLILDNCEHVIDGAAEAAERLVSTCPDARVLATSRIPLGIDGEQLLRLGGLALPAGDDGDDLLASPAVALFLDRARAVDGLAADDDLPAIAELCHRLDGLPLAIELAAGRTRSMTPREIADRLDERFAILRSTGRRTAARHATLDAAIAWSYDLLDDPHRRLFERLAVFARGGVVDDVRAVCAGDGIDDTEVAELLDGLVAHSLVTVAPSERGAAFGLLESPRAYAEARLRERGEDASRRDRHAEHYAARARAVRTAGWSVSPRPFHDQYDELRAALRWCLAKDPLLPVAPDLVEGTWWVVAIHHAQDIARLIEDIVDRLGDEHPDLPRVLGVAAHARLVAGDAGAAWVHADRAIALERPELEPALAARRALMMIAFFAPDLRDGLGRARDVAARSRAAGYDAVAVEANGFEVQLLHGLGASDDAARVAAAMAAEADRLGSDLLVTWAHYVRGVLAHEVDPVAAHAHYEEALAIAAAGDQQHLVRFSQRALGVLAGDTGRMHEARALLGEALEGAAAAGDRASQWTTLQAVGIVLAGAGRHEAAAELLAGAGAWPSAPFLRQRAAAAQDVVVAAIGADAAAALAERGTAMGLVDAAALAGRELDATER